MIFFMLSEKDFIIQSLDINLFFLRILKEHALFLEASLPTKNSYLARQANELKNVFEHLLSNALTLSYGIVSPKNDAVTDYTYEAEKATSFLTGIQIDTNLTKFEYSLQSDSKYLNNSAMVQNVYSLNNNAIAAAYSIINLKTVILNGMLDLRLYSTSYPLLIDHIRREANLYINILKKLQKRKDKNIIKDAIKQEAFWNRIMAEHAKFIRGYLDPTEDELIEIANNFGNQFDNLTKEALELTEHVNNLPEVTDESLKATIKIRDFKVQGTKGFLNGKIKSIALPLLADHVLREANHYLHLLKKYNEIQ